MTLALEIPLDSELTESLRAFARRQGQQPEQVVGDLVRAYVRQQRREQLARETAAYHAQHAALVQQYLGQHVAFFNGECVDHDADASALARRVRQKFGHEPVLVTQVQAAAEAEITLRSPRLLEAA